MPLALVGREQMFAGQTGRMAGPEKLYRGPLGDKNSCGLLGLQKMVNHTAVFRLTARRCKLPTRPRGFLSGKSRRPSRMGCGQSAAVAEETKKMKPSEHRLRIVDQNEVDAQIAKLQKCKLQIGERSELECHDGVEQVQSFNSWVHQLDSTDMATMKDGRALPINQWAHHQKANKTAKSLVKLMEDPSALKRAIKLKRRRLEASDETKMTKDPPEQNRPKIFSRTVVML
eukprot:s104_g36.t1